MDHITVPIGFAIFFAGSGALFALSFAGVCRLLKWAPINITVTINNPPGNVSSVHTPDPER